VPDDRPVLTADEQLAALQKDYDDFKSTALARLSTRPTGDFEPTFRSTAKAGSLFCLGQTLNRVDYPVLWQWAQDQGIAGVSNLFGNGNGTTTFTLPNLAGRVPIGVGTLGSDVYALGNAGGTAFVSLSTSQMPSHDHNINGSTNSASGHTHGFGTSTNGGHGGHTNAPSTVSVATGGAGSTNFPSFYNNFFGDHSHSGGTDNQGSHSHGLSLDVLSNGSGTSFDNRQPYFALNWMIFT
jgi:microcystin-dependent protein